MEQLSTLRATAQRLNSTPVEELPRIAGFLAASLSSCAALNEEPTKGVDFSATLHRLKVRLSSLLQDRSPAGRLTAAILIKAYVEVAPIESTQWEAWARGLITCLTRPDPVAVKQVCLTTITRIFVLCQKSQTLHREVVSPLLPSFLNNILVALKPSGTKYTSQTHEKLLSSALTCWDELLNHYSQTFRPFATRIKQICAGLLSDNVTHRYLRDRATEVLCSLHLCAPRATALADWNQTVAAVVDASHATSDLVFRAVIEDWRPTSASVLDRTIKHDYKKPPQLSQLDPAGLGPWHGLSAGVERAKTLLRWLRCTLRRRSQASELPLGEIMSLVTRFIIITVPSANSQIRTSSEVSRDEREELWASLPFLHIEVLRLCTTLTETLGLASVPIVNVLCQLTVDVYGAEGWNQSLRVECYRTIAQFIRINNNVLAGLDSLASLIELCCQDLMRSIEDHASGKLSGLVSSGSTRAIFTPAETSTKRLSRTHIDKEQNVQRSAEDLMVAILRHCPASQIPHPLRNKLDRAAVLCHSEAAMMASVINPSKHGSAPRAQPSLLPFLVQAEVERGLEVELLLRPRMPTVGGLRSLRARDESDIMEGLEETNQAIEFPNNDLDAAVADGEISQGFAASTSPSTQLPGFADEAVDEAVTKKRAFGTMLQNVSDTSKDGVRVEAGPHKKPRLDEAEMNTVLSESRRLAQPLSIEADGVHNPPLSPTPAGEAIVVHGNGTSVHTAVAGTIGDDSDDDSEIPEIDAELSVDEDDDGDE